MIAYEESGYIRVALEDAQKFWDVLRMRRASGLGDKFWQLPKPIFTPKKLAIRIGLCDGVGNLTSLCEKALSSDNWEEAKEILKTHYRGIYEEIKKEAEEKKRAERLRFEEMIKKKRVFNPLQVIPYAQWKWPWIYVSRIHYKRPEICRSRYGEPSVVFPIVYGDDANNKRNWNLLIEIGWINQLGEVNDDIVAALKERERKLLEAGGIISNNKERPVEQDQPKPERSDLKTPEDVVGDTEN